MKATETAPVRVETHGRIPAPGAPAHRPGGGLRFVEILTEPTGKRIDEDDYTHLATLASAVKFLAAG